MTAPTCSTNFTHAIILHGTAPDGIQRECCLAKNADGNFGVYITDKWGDGEPDITTFGMTPYGLHMLQQLMEMADRIDEHPLPPDAPDSLTAEGGE